MDRKILLHGNKFVELQQDEREASHAKKNINIMADSKQISSSNSNESKRVIKQIVSLDSKKLKALGIESNILSALTKFNGKEKSFANAKLSETVKNVESSASLTSEPSTSLPLPSSSSLPLSTALPVSQITSKIPRQQSPVNVSTISPVRSSVVVRDASLPTKLSETPSTKKIHVLSNVLLSENKLNLKDFTTIASSPTPINNTNIALATQVPKPEPVQSIQCIDIEELPVKQETNVNPNVLVDETVVIENSVATLSESQSPEIDVLKGFSIADLHSSKNHFENFLSEIQSKPTIQIDRAIEMNESIESIIEPITIYSGAIKTEMDGEIEIAAEVIGIQASTYTNSETLPSTPSSSSSSSSSSSEYCNNESESDLDELIKEAEATIKNELLNVTADSAIDEEPPVIAKKPRRVQKQLLDLLTEHIDKDRLIDEFLDSTINSFQMQCDSPLDSDAGSIKDEIIDPNPDVEINEEHNDFKGFEVSVMPKFNPETDHNLDDIQENVQIPKSQKRKTTDKSLTSSKKAKQKIMQSTDDGYPIQTNQLTPNSLNDSLDEQPHLSHESMKEIPVHEKETAIKLLKKQTAKKVAAAAATVGRKSKQPIISEYFAVKNDANQNIAKESVTDFISNSNDVAVKSSRYGRVIKPKSFDLDATPKVKIEPKSSQELFDATSLTEMGTKPPKKRVRHKTSDSMDIPSVECIPKEEIVSSFDTHISNDTLKLLAENRKSTEKSLAQINTSPNTVTNDDIHFAENQSDVVPAKKEIPKRRGRPSKFFSMEQSVVAANTHNSDINKCKEQTITSTICVNSMAEEEPLVPTKPAPIILKRKRPGRPSKRLSTKISVSVNESEPNTSINESSIKLEGDSSILNETICNEMIPNQSIEQMDTTIQSDASVTAEIPVKKGRGRPRIKPIKPTSANDDIDNGPKFTCGNCQKEVAKGKWKAHESTHLGVTFRVGIDEAIDVEDSATQSRIMIRFMKANKIQYLKCPKCGDKKRSAIGYISHVEICGLTEAEAQSLRAECEFCKKSYRKASLATHQLSFCPVRRLEQAQQKADEEIKTVRETTSNDQPEEVIYSESGRPKRMIKKVKILTKNVDEFIKVGLKITGGTFKNWNNKLREDNIIRCTNGSCAFSTADIGEMRTHYKQCRESIHQCKICLHVERARDEIVRHIETVHPEELKVNQSDEDGDNPDDADFRDGNDASSSSDGEYDDDDDGDIDGLHERSVKKHFKGGKRKRTVPLKRVMEEEAPSLWDMVSTFYTRILNTRPGYYRRTHQWTKEFVEQNYDLDALVFKDHMQCTFDYVRLPQREQNKFLNLLNLKSPTFLCHIGTKYKQEKSELIDGNWSRLNLLNSMGMPSTSDQNPLPPSLSSSSSVLYCGGRILTAEWVPFPSDYTGPQVLAICAQSQGAKPVNLTNCEPPEKCKNLIQLWNVSMETTNTIGVTEFLYGIAYENGPICSMAFCPSDVYIASKRLAILAVPDTNGNINLMSLPDNVSKGKSNATTVIKVKSDIKLQLGFNQNENAPQIVTQITWLRVKGHKVLCAGYNTGLVAIWNFDHLNLSYMCNSDTSDGIPILAPQRTFMGATSFVTQLDLHSDSDGSARWVLVGALDRRMRLYDLLDPQLVPFTSQPFKSRIISGAWPIHWPIYLTITDSALSRLNGGLYIKQVLYTDTQPRNPSLQSDCEPSNFAFSDWLNTGIFGNDMGDLTMINFQQLLLHDRYDESSEQKVLSSTDVFFDEQQIISDESETNARIKVLFTDFNKTDLNTDARYPPVDQYPYARITRVAINPNESHQKLYAVGYELGFCRINFMP